MMIYFLLFLIPFLVSVASIPFLISLAKKANLFDISAGDVLKIHKVPTPFLGGGAMIFSFVIGFLFFYFYKGFDIRELWGIILASSIIFLLGFWDDLKWKHSSKTKPITKFISLIVFSFLVTLILSAINIKIIFFPAQLLSFITTFLYVFVFINAVNYQDGMDGLAAALSLISLLAFIIVGFICGNDLSLYFSFIILGGVTGFLFFNFPPAKIFMGDSGAYFLGFVLMILTALHVKNYDIFSLIGTIFIVGIPLFDGVFTNIRRILNGKSIFWGDRDHLYDIILRKTNSQKKTLLISCALQTVLSAIGIVLITL